MCQPLRAATVRQIMRAEGVAGVTANALALLNRHVARLCQGIARDTGKRHRVSARDVATSLNLTGE